MTQSDTTKLMVMPQLKMLEMEPVVEFLPMPLPMVLLQLPTNSNFTFIILWHRNRQGYILHLMITELKRQCNNLLKNINILNQKGNHGYFGNGHSCQGSGENVLVLKCVLELFIDLMWTVDLVECKRFGVTELLQSVSIVWESWLCWTHLQ
jgi:hypothetical protein